MEWANVVIFLKIAFYSFIIILGWMVFCVVRDAIRAKRVRDNMEYLKRKAEEGFPIDFRVMEHWRNPRDVDKP